MIKYRFRGKFDPAKLAVDNIDRLSTGLIKPKTKVLELGCATGFMGEYLRRRLGCQVTGVDINPAVKPEIAGDLNLAATWRKIKAKAPFDLVLASAILEHLPRPEQTLQLIKQVLKPQGELIVTLPNIAHWRARLNLVLGRFEYEDYGIFDRTHLRFFTYFTAQKLIQDAGFKLKRVLIDPAGGMKYFNWLVKRWPNLYAHQICLYATVD
jgi:SAM-dependent methyltransferase